MPEISTLRIAELTGHDRQTVRKYLRQVPFRRDGEGEKATKFYESKEVLTLRQIAENMTPQDALAVARRGQIELEMEVLRKQRPRIEEVLETVEAVFGDVAGIIKGSDLSDDRKADILTRLRDGQKELA